MIDTTRRYYLAGPMTGIPQFNFPAFESATQELRLSGVCVHSPHEWDSSAVQAAAWASPDGKLDAGGMVAGETWGHIISRDVKIVADDVDGLVLLPGWQRSRGARLEAFVGILTGKTFYTYPELTRCASRYIMEVIADTTLEAL